MEKHKNPGCTRDTAGGAPVRRIERSVHSSTTSPPPFAPPAPSTSAEDTVEQVLRALDPCAEVEYVLHHRWQFMRREQQDPWAGTCDALHSDKQHVCMRLAGHLGPHHRHVEPNMGELSW